MAISRSAAGLPLRLAIRAWIGSASGRGDSVWSAHWPADNFLRRWRSLAGTVNSSPSRLPSKQELISQLHHAGFQDVQTVRLAPGEELFAFRALPGENA